MARNRNKKRKRSREVARRGASTALGLVSAERRLSSLGMDPDDIRVGGKFLHENRTYIRTVLDLDEREGIVKYKDQRGHEGECKLATFAKTVINELSPEMPTARDEMEASAIVKVNPTDKKIRICYLTPALAEALIARNVHNRNVSRSRVASYAKEIREGRWSDNGQTIVVADSGELLDGGHRCHAVILAGIAIPIVLVENVADPRAFHTIDTGKTRTNTDVLTISGQKNTQALGAVLAYLWRYENRTADALPRARVSHGETLDTMGRYPLAVEAALFKGLRGLRDLRCLAQAGLAWIALVETVGRKEADEFVSSMATGLGLREGDPVAILRNRLAAYNKHKHTGTGMRDRVMAITIMAANATIQGKELRKLSWDESKVFPRFVNETMFDMAYVRPKEPRNQPKPRARP